MLTLSELPKLGLQVDLVEVIWVTPNRLQNLLACVRTGPVADWAGLGKARS